MNKFLGLLLVLILTVEVSAQNTINNVPYFYQYSNSVNPDGSCQNTSMAMILKYYGYTSVTPDVLSNDWGTSKAQTVPGFEEMFNSVASSKGISVRDNGSVSGTIAQLQASLDEGRPVVVHAYFTSYGHVIVVLGYDADYYYVNDPAGTWNTTVCGGGYSGDGATAGKYAKYQRAAFEKLITSSSCSTQDGKVWLHLFSGGIPATSISENTFQDVNVFYSAVAGNIKIEGSRALKEFELYDNTGRLVKTVSLKSESNIEIPANEISQGIYIVKLTELKGKQSVTKLLKY